MSITTMPIDRLRPARSCRADSLGTQPSLAMAVVTRSRVCSLTRSGEFTTLDTVPSETPASAATSFMLTEALLRRHAIRLSTQVAVSGSWLRMVSDSRWHLTP